MADVTRKRPPAPVWRPNARFGLNGFGASGDGTYRSLGLAAGKATANGQVNYEVIPVSGCSTVSVRLKTATNGGTLDLFGVGPDFNPDQGIADNTAYASLTGTIYTTGNPSQVAITAGTEAIITYTCKGESYLVIKFSGTVGAGTITYCDVSWQPMSTQL